MDVDRRRAGRRRLEAGGLAVAFALLALGLFSSSGRDDPYISYWPALTLAEQGEILNYNGERVEQSSSALHVFVLALARLASRAELAELGGWLGLGFGAATVWWALQLGRPWGTFTARATGLLTASCGSLLYWSLGGLETSLAAAIYTLWCLAANALLASGSSAARRGAWLRVALASLAVVLVRPEGPLVLASATAGLVVLSAWAERSDERSGQGGASVLLRAAGLLAIAATASALVVALRLGYFGSALPEPVLAKAGGLSLRSVEAGARYTLAALLPSPLAWLLLPAWLAGAVVGVRDWRARPQRAAGWLAAALLLAANVAFAVASGGDWMEAGRFLVPTAALLALLAARGLCALPVRARGPALVGLVALQLGGALAIARSEATGMPLWRALERTTAFRSGDPPPAWFERGNRIHRRDLPLAHHLGLVVEALHERLQRPVRVLSRQMGMVVFSVAREHPGRIQTLDRRGIVDRAFRTCPVSRGVSRSPVGLGIDNAFAFAHRAELAACGVPPPDVLFDLGPPPSAKSLARYGVELAVVYHQRGLLDSGSTWLPGARVDGKAFIAVVGERAGDLGPGWPIRLELPAF